MTAAEMLYAARTNSRKSRELPVIAKKLCIREEFLEALETGNYSVLPEIVYILGFARNYAIELGLDPKVISEKLKQELGVTPIDEGSNLANPDVLASRSTIESPKVVPATDFESPLPASDVQKKDAPMVAKTSAFAVKKIWAFIISGAVVVIAAAAILIASLSGNDGEQSVQPVATVEATDGTQEIKFNIPVKFEYSAENKGVSRIVMQATGETWVKIEAKGDTLFSRVLMPGDVYYLPADKVARATIGNAGGLDIFVDGKLTPKLGEVRTRVVNVPLTPENLLKNAAVPKTAE
jgi:cytoskeleton protein RodZ